jgi:very-short-patch-repair endonuclease
MDEKKIDIQDLLEICDSDFERDVFKRLNAIGYRVTPQVRVGAYSIDLVIDGTEDKRLAVELDGDRYHTPDRWADDLARQRVLERVGWRFWRCWGSSYALDPDACMDDLVSTLNDMGIERLGSSLIPTIYTEHRILKSPQELESEIETAVPELGESHVKSVTSPSAEVVLGGNLNTTAKRNSSDELVIQVGDRVLIAYNDEPARQYMLTLSGQQHDPDNLIINVDKPLAKALLGYVEEDEVEIPAGGRIRTATILKVERPTHMVLQ